MGAGLGFGGKERRLGFGVSSEEVLKVKQGAEHLPRHCQQAPPPPGCCGCSEIVCGSLLTVSIRFTPTQLLAFLQGLFTFYHHGYELAKDFSDFKTELTISIQNVSVPRATVPRAPHRDCPAELANTFGIF